MTSTFDGSWRPNTPFVFREGLAITMRSAKGLSPSGVLKVPFRFQVPPMGEFRRPYHYNWSTFDTLSAGQHARPMGKQLLELAIETMLMDGPAMDASVGVAIWPDRPDPERVLAELRYIQRREAPFRLTISQPAIWKAPLINALAVLTNVEPSQHPGELGTEYLSVTFLEYPELAVGRQRREPDMTPTIYKVKLGKDDLYEIAKHFFHKPSAWRDIASVNGITKVSPGSEDQLKAWMKRHHKTTLKIPRALYAGRKVARRETPSLGAIR